MKTDRQPHIPRKGALRPSLLKGSLSTTNTSRNGSGAMASPSQQLARLVYLKDVRGSWKIGLVIDESLGEVSHLNVLYG